MLTHPTPRIASLQFFLAAPEVGTSWYWDMAGYVLSQLPEMDLQGLSGYSYVSSNFSWGAAFSPVNVDAIGARFVLLDTEDTAGIQALWEPVFEYVNRTWPESRLQTQYTTYASLLEWFLDTLDPLQPGLNEWSTSHLMTAESMRDPQAVSEAWKTVTSVGGLAGAALVAGNGTRNAKPRDGGNSVSPAWRKTAIETSRNPLQAVFESWWHPRHSRQIH